MKKTIFVVLPLVAMLAACGQGTGTGAQGGTTLGVAAGDQETLQRVKSLQVAQNTNVNISFPAAGVIVGAVAEGMFDTLVGMAGSGGGSEAIFKVMASYDTGISPEEFGRENAPLLVEDYKESMEQYGTWPSVFRGVFTRSPDTTDPRLIRLREILKTGELPKIAVELEKMGYAHMIQMATEPKNGWPSDVNPIGKRPAANEYIHKVQKNVEFSNLVLTELASMLSASAWKDPAAAREAALIAWQNIPIQKLRDAYNSVAATPFQGVAVDLTGHKGMHWYSAAGDFVGDGAGWTVIKNGAPWYGNGYLSGRQVTISLASAISASQSQQSGTTTSTGNNSSLDAGSNSQVK